MGDTDDGSDDDVLKVPRTVHVYEKRMPPTNDGRNTHDQVLQSIEYFKQHVHLPNKHWNIAKNGLVVDWFYLDTDGKETSYNAESDTSEVDDEEEEDDEEEAEASEPPISKKPSKDVTCTLCNTEKLTNASLCPNPGCEKSKRPSRKRGAGTSKKDEDTFPKTYKNEVHYDYKLSEAEALEKGLKKMGRYAGNYVYTHIKPDGEALTGSTSGTSPKKPKLGETDRTREQFIEKKKVLGHMKLMWKGIKSGTFPVIHATNLFGDFGELYTELTGDSFDHNAPKWPGN